MWPYIFVTSFSTLANFIRIQHFGSKTTISGLRNTNKHLFLVHSCSIVNILCNIQGKILRVVSSWNLVAIENFLLRHLIFNTQTKCHFNEPKNHKCLFKSENWYSITSLKYPYLIFWILIFVLVWQTDHWFHLCDVIVGWSNFWNEHLWFLGFVFSDPNQTKKRLNDIPNYKGDF